MASLLVLVRHGESTKNINPRFSTIEGQEVLTDEGLSQADSVAVLLSGMIARKKPESIGYFSPPATRSLATAQRLSRGAGVVVVDGLSPIRSPYPGLTEEEVSRVDPRFARQVDDYRSGLRSAYDIPRGEGEAVLEFERRVAQAIDHVLELEHELSIVVGHRSTLTATLLRVARMIADYPVNWYGHVSIPLASVWIVQLNKENAFCGFETLHDEASLDSRSR